MLQEVSLGQRSIADYTHLVGRGLVDEIRELSKPFEGARVLHVSATAFGGGVSEILYTLVPLMRDVGLDAHWHVILGREEFFNVTKLMHNSLQGDEQTLTEQQWEVFFGYNAMNAKGLESGWDAIIIHDPQPAAMRQNAPDRAKRWIWRCHIDLSTPNPATLARMLPMIESYDASVWHMEQYVPTGLEAPNVNIVPPAIDPLSPKNMALSPDDAAFVCDQFGIDVDRPLIDPGLALRPLEGPDRRDRRVPPGHRGDPRGPARARRLDGDRRPRGLGVLPQDLQLRRRRPRHQDPQQPQQRRRDRGQRLPVAVRRRASRSRSARASA